MSTRRLLLMSGSIACAVVAGGLLLSQQSCSPAQCTQSALTPNEPSPALECAAGLLCYLGQCIKSCNAGQERAIECGSEDDCDATRPNCVGGYCSACEDLEVCVPTLNICQPSTEVDPGEPPDKPQAGSPKPPAPLDAGTIDGGIVINKDVGTNEVPVEPITHAGLIDVAQLEDFTGGGNSAKVTVRILDVSAEDEVGVKWRLDPWTDAGGTARPPAVDVVIQESGQCNLSALEVRTASAAPANLGSIAIDSHAEHPNSVIRTEVPFNGTDYAVPAVPATLLTFSRLSPSEPHFITASSSGSELTADSWPNPEPSNGHHVPFALIPFDDTETLIRGTFNVSDTTPQDLVVRWNTIRVGTVPGERVVLRFRGETHMIRCEQIEDMGARDDITVNAALLSAFRDAEQLAPNTTLKLYFERASQERLAIPRAGDNVIDVSVRVRHTLIGQIRFL